MATIRAQVLGGAAKEHTASTVGELKTKLGMENSQARVDGEIKEDSYSLQDGEFVTFANKVKGAN